MMKTQRGFSLVEVMVAAAILGMAATALFGLFSRSLLNLGRIQDLHHYQLAGEEVMNRVLLLPSLPPGGTIEGRIDRLDARWVVNVSPWIPANLEDRPADAVLKIDVEILWQSRSDERSIKLETVRVSALQYSDYDFKRAVENVFPN
jgi:general secretion pathway protein I